MGFVIFIVFVAAILVVVAMPEGTMISGVDGGEFITRAVYGLIAVTLGISLIHRYRGRLGAAARDALIWLTLIVVFIGLYAYRETARPVYERIVAEFTPGYVVSTSPGVAEVARRGDGHFIVRMKANGVELPFLFDTGASAMVLRFEDAKRVGIDPKALKFTEIVSTANGMSRAAETRIDRLSVGTITQSRVIALVAREGALNENLLGQNFLDGLAGYGVEGGRLVLRGKAR